jgi:hypothetical protein
MTDTVPVIMPKFQVEKKEEKDRKRMWPGVLWINSLPERKLR